MAKVPVCRNVLKITEPTDNVFVHVNNHPELQYPCLQSRLDSFRYYRTLMPYIYLKG